MQKTLLVAILVFCGFEASALAASCNPRDYLDTDFSKQDQFTRLVWLSNMNESQYNKANTDAHGEMTIPYIDTPASASYKNTQEMSHQVARLLNIDYEDSSSLTLLHLGLTKIGVEAYLGCIRAEHVVLKIDNANPTTDTDFFISATWYPEHGDVAKFNQPPDVSGGKFVTKVNNGATIGPGYSYRFHIKRDPDGPPLKFAMDFNGIPATLDLPPLLRKATVVEVATFPAYGTPPLMINSDNSNAWGYHSKSACYDAPSGREFLYGSAVAIPEALIRKEWGAKVSVAYQDDKRVCLLVETNAPTSDVGGATWGRVSVKTIRAVDIDPKSPASGLAGH